MINIIVGGGILRMPAFYVRVSLAAWRAQRSEPFVLPGGPLIPPLGLVAMLPILVTLTAREWMAIGMALGVLVLVYGLLRVHQRHLVVEG